MTEWLEGVLRREEEEPDACVWRVGEAWLDVEAFLAAYSGRRIRLTVEVLDAEGVVDPRSRFGGS